MCTSGWRRSWSRAFLDAHLFVASLKTLKYFVIFGDIHHSLHLLRWREDIHMLHLLGRDPIPASIFASDFVVMGSTVGFLASDQQGNLQMITYDPNDPEYRRQQLLVPTDLHLGAHVNKM